MFYFLGFYDFYDIIAKKSSYSIIVFLIDWPIEDVENFAKKSQNQTEYRASGMIGRIGQADRLVIFQFRNGYQLKIDKLLNWENC